MTWDTADAIRFLTTGEVAGVVLGMSEEDLPSALGAPEYGRAMRGLTLRRFERQLEVTTRNRSVVLIQLVLARSGPLQDAQTLAQLLLATFGITATISDGGRRLATDRRTSVVWESDRAVSVIAS